METGTTKPIIIIADAHIPTHSSVSKTLSEEYLIIDASDGLAVLSILETQTIAAILYDLHLPSLDAKAFLMLRQGRKHLQGPPLFILTTDQQEALQATKLDPFFLVEKPIKAELLKKKLQKVLQPKEQAKDIFTPKPLHQDELSLWDINPSEMQSGFALYQYAQEQSFPIYVDQGMLSLSGVHDLEAFRVKYPRIDTFIKEENITIFNHNVRQAIDNHSSFSFSMGMKGNANHGSELFFQISWIPYAGQEAPVFLIMVLDSSQLRENQRQLCSLIQKDALTGIYNQETFYRKTGILLRQNSETTYLFIRWNIDRFKAVNDLFGTSAGNAILRSLGMTFTKLVGERGTYGRLYSDHFALCVPKKDFDPEHFAREAERQLNANHLKTYVRSTFGIYEISDPTMDVSLMNDRANMALNTAKGNYQKPYAYYTDILRRKMLKEQAIVNEMHSALELGQFQIYLQPFYSLTENRFTAAEALVRWIHPERGIIAPDAFIPMFEENGFIIALDDYVIEQVCILQRRLLDEGRPTSPISVNLSRSDFFNQNLAQNIIEKTDRYNIPHSLLMFEITESVYTENPEELLKAMVALQKEGFLILMDDFGSGYSSLNILKDVPIDILKLDLMFSKEIGKSERSENIIRSIVNMSVLLGLPLIIEGIETIQQVDFYKLLECNTLQGFYFSRPLPIEQFLTLDMVHYRPSSIPKQPFQHLKGFSLSEMQSKILKALFEQIYLFDYTSDRYQQLYNDPLAASLSSESQGNLSTFLSLIEEKKIQTQERESFHLFTHARMESVMSQRFPWVNSKGESEIADWTLIKLDNSDTSNLVLCCIRSLGTACPLARGGSDYHDCAYRSRHSLIEELANTKVLEWDLQQDILYKNPNLELLQICKIAPKALIAKEYCCPFIHEDDLKAFEDTLEEVLKIPSKQGTTVRLRLLNGEYRWYSIQMKMHYAENSGAKRIMALLLDVDTKMRLSEQAREYKRQIEFMTTSATWGIATGYLSDTGSIVPTFHNPAFFKLLGYSQEEYEALGKNWLTMIRPRDHQRLSEILKAKEDSTLHFHLTKKDGLSVSIRASLAFTQPERERTEFICNLFEEEPSPQHAASSSTVFGQIGSHTSEIHQQDLLLEHSVLITFEYDLATDSAFITFPNPDKSRGNGVFYNFTQKYLPNMVHTDSLGLFNAIVEKGRKGPTSGSFEVKLDFFQKGFVWYLCNYMTLADDSDKVYKYIGSLVDIHREKEFQESLARQTQINKSLREKSRLDLASGLLNKTTLEEKITKELGKTQKPWFLLITDLDNFKAVNDSLGHQKGDTLISVMAKTLKETFFSEEAIIGRFGGDEFVVFSPYDEELFPLLDNFQKKLSAYASENFLFSSSSGIALFPEHGNTFSDLLHYADKALYEAKSAGKSQYRVYQPE